jgi:hypothetical protein
MENYLNLTKKEERSLQKSRKGINLSIFGKSPQDDWAIILGFTVLVSVVISGLVFIKYQSVLKEIDARPESVITTDESLNFNEVKKVIQRYDLRARVLNNFE